MRLLVTRPIADSLELAERLTGAGHEVVIQPLLKINYFTPDEMLFENVQALIATSKNGLRALVQKDMGEAQLSSRLTARPLFAVGAATASLAETIGFQKVYQGKASAQSLLPLIHAHCKAERGPLLHLAGQHLAFDLKKSLAEDGFQLKAPIVYHARAIEEFAPPIIQSLQQKEIDAVLLLSPRTALLFQQLVGKHRLNKSTESLLHYCLSPAVAEKLDGLPERKIKIAKEPSLKEVLALINRETAQ